MRRYLGFIVVCLAFLFSSISQTSASVAFPVIMRDLHTSLVTTGWILTSYTLAITIVMALAGKISDLLGIKKAFLLYTGLFTIGSILSAVTSNIYFLIIARIIQGLGAGGFMPGGASIISHEFPEDRQRYIGFLSSVWPIGIIIGPNLGGWMVEAFGWQSVFWINVPLGLVVTILAFFLLKPVERKKTHISVDIVGTGLLMGALIALMFAFTEFESITKGNTWMLITGLFVLGIILLVAFWRREVSIKEPLVNVKLLKERPFLASNIYNLINGGCILGVFSLMPLYTISVHHLTVLQSGTVLTPRAIGQIIASFIVSAMLVKWGYRKPLLTGTCIILAAMVIFGFQPHGFTLMGVDITDMTILLVLLGAWGIGNGMLLPAANNACIELMPDQVATISGLRGMFRNIGSTFTVALMTVVINNVTDPTRAYTIVFFAGAAIVLVTIPSIFLMPSSPTIRTATETSSTTAN